MPVDWVGGATDGNQCTNGHWLDKELEQHINVLELKAAYFALRSFCKDKFDIHVRLMMDNTTAIAYVNNMGGTKSSICNKIAKEIWDWVSVQKIWISAAHIPGKYNVAADRESPDFSGFQ